MDEKTLNAIVDTVVAELAPQDDMTLEAARRLSRKVMEEAKRIGVKAVVAISNKAANPVLVECMDDSFIASYDVAVGKAYTVCALKMPTSELKKLVQPGGSLYGIQFTNQGKIVIFGGGELLYNKNGQLIGGLGVSGGTEAQDTALAEFGKKVFGGKPPRR